MQEEAGKDNIAIPLVMEGDTLRAEVAAAEQVLFLTATQPEATVELGGSLADGTAVQGGYDPAAGFPLVLAEGANTKHLGYAKK